MSRRENAQPVLVKSIVVLASAVGLFLLSSYVLTVPWLQASEIPLVSSTFISPIGNPELELDKTVDDDAPEPGDVIEYTLAYSTTNAGSRAYNVRLYDFLPAGLEFISSNPGGSYSDGVILFTDDSVGPGTETVAVRANVLAGYRALYNHALVTADGVTPGYDSLHTSVRQLPVELQLDKLGYSAVLVDDPLVYVLRCENDSENEVNSVTVMDFLPDGVDLVEASPAAEQEEPFLRWMVGDLGPKESFESVITVTAPSSTGMITNTALADALQRVFSQEVFATEVITEGAILRVYKDRSAPTVDLGDQLVYTLHYENAGNSPASDVVLTDTLPSDVTVTSASPDPITFDRRLGWDLGWLEPGMSEGTVVFTVTVEGGGGRWLHNIADVVGESDSFSGHDEEWTWVRPPRVYLPVIMRDY